MDAFAHSNLTGIAIVALAALVCGMTMERVKQPAFVGYILAGLLLGPTAFGIVEDREQINTIAELGVLMLLFVIGMELSIRLFLRLWKFVLIATSIQILAAGSLTLLLSSLLGWSFGMSILLGFVIALSSTAIGIKILEDTNELKTRTGILSVGILIAQDLAFIPIILVLGIISVGETDYQGLLVLIGSILIMVMLMWYLAKGGKVHLPFLSNVVQNVDLTPLGALALCFGAAAISGLLGLSPAYGAFLAGLVLGNSGERPAFVGSTRPIQSILMMVFFLSIGLLIDLPFIIANLGTVLVLLFVVTIFKTAMNTAILKLLGQPWPQAFMVSVVLSQIGEFSFLLSKAGLEAGLIGEDVLRLVVAVTVLSLAVSPFWVVTARRLHKITGSVVTLRELMTFVYSYEADFIAAASLKIRPKCALVIRRLKNGIEKKYLTNLINKLNYLAARFTKHLSSRQKINAANDNPLGKKNPEKKVSKSA